jgi:hypothetical protein
MNLLIPRIWAYLAVLALGVAIWGHGWVTGATHNQEKELKQTVKDVQVLVKVRDRVVTQYVDRERIVYKQADTIIKQVPVYITPEADDQCPVPDGFIRVHDAAARGVSLDAAPGTPDATTPRASTATSRP